MSCERRDLPLDGCAPLGRPNRSASLRAGMLAALTCAGTVGAMVGAGCSALVSYEIPATSGATTSGPFGGTGGTAEGGGGRGGTSSGGAAGAGGAVSTGGTGGGTVTSCEPLDLDACGTGAKCSVVDVATGETGCVAAGEGTAWQQCDEDQDCVAGSWCDLPTAVCRPICQSVDHCALGARCLPASAVGGAAIPFLGLCTAHCDPISADPCVFGCVYLTDPPEFDCRATGDLAQGQPCGDATDCMRGLTCFDDACWPWCPEAELGGQCSTQGSPMLCTATVPATVTGGAEYGVCVPDAG